MDEAAIGFTARFGGPIARALRRMGMGDATFASLRRDLAILERSPERHLAEKVTIGIFGFFVVPFVAGFLALDGAHLPIVLPIWGAALFGIAGFFVPDLGVHTEASARRAEFRHGLSAYLDLVVIVLAAGGGIETALADASDVGDGFAFVRLRRSLDDARLAHLPPGEAFGRLGSDLGVDELVELSASLALAGAEGARRALVAPGEGDLDACARACRRRDYRSGGDGANEPSARAVARGLHGADRVPRLVRVSHGL